MFTLRTTTLCCVLLAAQAHNGYRNGYQRNGQNQSGNYQHRYKGGAGPDRRGPGGFGGADGDWRKERSGQTGPDTSNPERGVGRPIADPTRVRHGYVLSGTVESTCAACKNKEMGWSNSGPCGNPLLCGNAQIMLEDHDRQAGETRPVISFFDKEGVMDLHPLPAGVKVKFTVVPGRKSHQVRAVKVERNMDGEHVPASATQQDINTISNVSHSMRHVPAARTPTYDQERIKSIYREIGQMTTQMIAQNWNKTKMPKIDMLFNTACKEVARNAAETNMTTEQVQAAVRQLVEELLRRAQQQGRRSESPSSGTSNRSRESGLSPKDGNSRDHSPTRASPADDSPLPTPPPAQGHDAAEQPRVRNVKGPKPAPSAATGSSQAWRPKSDGKTDLSQLKQRLAERQSNQSEQSGSPPREGSPVGSTGSPAGSADQPTRRPTVTHADKADYVVITQGAPGLRKSGEESDHDQD